MDAAALPPLVSRVQAAKYLGVTPQALSQIDGRGEGPPYVKVGRSVRYRREDFLAWIDSRIVRPPRRSEGVG